MSKCNDVLKKKTCRRLLSHFRPFSHFGLYHFSHYQQFSGTILSHFGGISDLFAWPFLAISQTENGPNANDWYQPLGRKVANNGRKFPKSVGTVQNVPKICDQTIYDLFGQKMTAKMAGTVQKKSPENPTVAKKRGLRKRNGRPKCIPKYLGQNMWEWANRRQKNPEKSRNIC